MLDSSGNHPGWVYIIFMSLLPLFYVQTFSKWIFLSELIKKHISVEFFPPLHKQGYVVEVFMLSFNWINDIFLVLIWINLDYFRPTSMQHCGNKGLKNNPACTSIYIWWAFQYFFHSMLFCCSQYFPMNLALITLRIFDNLGITVTFNNQRLFFDKTGTYFFTFLSCKLLQEKNPFIEKSAEQIASIPELLVSDRFRPSTFAEG